MPNILVTFEFSAGRQAWTESHYSIGTSNIDDTAIKADLLALARAALLGKYATLDVVRLSERDPIGRTATYDLSGPATGTWPVTTVKGKWSTDVPNVALLLKLQGASRPKQLYLAGIPDVVVAVDPTDVLAYNPDPSFTPAVTFYLNALKAQWGYRHRNNGVPGQIGAIVTNVGFPGMVGVTASFDIGSTLGNLVQVRGCRRLNLRSPSINGIWQVAGVIIATGPPPVYTTFLRASGGVDPSNFTKLGTVALQGFQIVPYGDGEVAKVVTRKRGGSIGLPRGRSRTRV